MKIAIPKETIAGERRVAMGPDVVKRLVEAGNTVVVEKDAGKLSFIPDEKYKDAGAEIASSATDLYRDATIIAKVRPPQENEVKALPEKSVLVCLLDVLRTPELAKNLAEQKITSFALEMVPRISRAQSMDVLSSQASAAGYKAVLLAAAALHKFFPMLTTAAGTIAPAKVFILGAGVAGLQAIATAKRLGANVEAFDIREAAKGEVESLGARFVEIKLEEETATEGGYAKQVSQDTTALIQKTLLKHVSEANIVVTTAQVPGKKAPVLVTKPMIEAMRPGSVIVDMAVEQGGNVEGSEIDKEIEINGVRIIGPVNLPSTMAIDTTMMFGRNIHALLKLLIKEGELNLNFEDQIINESCVTHDGEIISERIKEMLK